MPQLPDFTSYLSLILSVCVVIGGFFAVRNGRRVSLTKFQKGTIEAMQQRLNLLEATQTSLKKINEEQQYQLDMIAAGLKKKGIFFTFDGDMLVLTGPGNQQQQSSNTRRAPRNPKPRIESKDMTDED